jgi:putative bacteriocin precursor
MCKIFSSKNFINIINSRGGEIMKKLGKKVAKLENTIEAYACMCQCPVSPCYWDNCPWWDLNTTRRVQSEYAENSITGNDANLTM